MAKKEDWMPKCQYCSFFSLEPKDYLGLCHRYPPKIINIGDDDYESMLPVVAKDDWCGEFHRFVN